MAKRGGNDPPGHSGLEPVQSHNGSESGSRSSDPGLAQPCPITRNCGAGVSSASHKLRVPPASLPLTHSVGGKEGLVLTALGIGDLCLIQTLPSLHNWCEGSYVLKKCSAHDSIDNIWACFDLIQHHKVGPGSNASEQSVRYTPISYEAKEQILNK